MTLPRRALLACLAALALPGVAAAEGFVVLGSTTTTENSGLLAHLAPLFEAETGIALRVVVAGTGKILRLAENGDVDVALTHDPVGERAFVEANPGASRRDAMANDFLIAGPEEDPAKVAEAAGAADAFARIAAASARFYSRGDDSGTHRRERAIWAGAGLSPKGDWYRETGAGMGATLNVAAASGGYLLVDRGTWASFGRRAGLEALVEGDPAFRNQYGVVLPPPDRPDPRRRAAAEAFADWLTGPEGQAAIAAFEIDGARIFAPNAAPRG